MTRFDATAIEKLGWRQGAVLGSALAARAREQGPSHIEITPDDWLIVVSHDCDVANGSLDKEPVIEVLRAVVLPGKAPEKMQAGGRNPRVLQLQIDEGIDPIVLSCAVHERWPLPREFLALEAPLRFLPDKHRRLIAEWLAKRYIRAAFPTAFDARWHRRRKEWEALLQRHSEIIQGVYLRLSTMRELTHAEPYQCQLLVAVPADRRGTRDWPAQRELLEREINAFWGQFVPGISCDGVEVLGNDEITLADIELYQRFDADWVSFADDTPVTPAAVDMRM